jgi:hypothetical protein
MGHPRLLPYGTSCPTVFIRCSRYRTLGPFSLLSLLPIYLLLIYLLHVLPPPTAPPHSDTRTPAYRQDFTFVCPTEILAFNKAIEDFKAIGAEIIVSSTDSEFVSLR